VRRSRTPQRDHPSCGLFEVNFSGSHIKTISVIAVSAQPVGVDFETLGATCADRVVGATARKTGPTQARVFGSPEKAYIKLVGTGLAAEFQVPGVGAPLPSGTAGQQAQQFRGRQLWITEVPEG
jgi:phosphopantetheinyl transferase